MSAAYERTVTLAKPLGIVLEEREDGGVRFEAFQEGGAAALAAADGSVDVAPGDRLLMVGDTDCSLESFENIMSIITEADSPVRLTVDDGLPRLDITPNLAKSLTPDVASMADRTVRAAVRECRRIVGASAELQTLLGTLLRVEILLGAGMRADGRCLVRFFGIFSTDGGGTTYSCNVSATGSEDANEGMEILALSCAKDEGWGRTIDLRREQETG